MKSVETRGAHQQPITLLRQLQKDSMGAGAISFEKSASKTWRGFVLPIHGMHIVTPMTSDVELINKFELHPVPASKPWLRGIVNNRGELYTVVDFSQFLGQKPIEKLNEGFLFILADTQLKSALLFQDRVNLRSFDSDLTQLDGTVMDPVLAPYLSTVLLEKNLQWGVLDLQVLCADPVFCDVGL